MKKNKRVLVTLTPELHHMAMERANEECRSFSAYINYLIKKDLKEKELAWIYMKLAIRMNIY